MACQVSQRQKPCQVSHTESLELVRCLLRVSIFHVSYLRGLFPEDNFKGVDMKNLEGMHIKMLAPTCDESKRLIEWVEGGVYDAMKRGYLKTVFFGISSDMEGQDLLEEYIFSFAYSDNGEIEMDITADAKNGKKKSKRVSRKKNKAIDVHFIRYQVCRLMRMLVSICNTLDKIPTERYVFMKLMYYDHTPDDYEPPHFAPMEANKVGRFDRVPVSINVGEVRTDHHTVALKVKSTLDCTGTDDHALEHGRVDEVMEDSCGDSTGTGGGGGASHMEMVQSCASVGAQPNDMDEVSSEPNMQQDKLTKRSEEQFPENHWPGMDGGFPPAATQTTGGEKTVEQRPRERGENKRNRNVMDEPKRALDLFDGGGREDANITSSHQYSQILKFCVRHPEVDITDVFARFTDVPIDVIENVFRILVRRGVLEQTQRKHKYRVLKDPGNEHANMTTRMDSLSVADNYAKEPRSIQPQSRDSREGLVKSNLAGSERTMSFIKTNQSRAPCGGKMDRVRPPPSPVPDPADHADIMHSENNMGTGNRMPFVGSQPTDDKYRTKKVSYVANPIQHNKRLRIGKGASRLARMQNEM